MWAINGANIDGVSVLGDISVVSKSEGRVRATTPPSILPDRIASARIFQRVTGSMLGDDIDVYQIDERIA